MLTVVSWRVFAYFCCQSTPKFDKITEDNDQMRNGKIPSSEQIGESGPPVMDQIQEDHIGWVTEAKDWAGELISGQTATGRILVSKQAKNLYNSVFMWN